MLLRVFERSAENLYRREEYKDAARFSARAMLTENRVVRTRAFNLLGLSAMVNRQYQLAYDVLFSWINYDMSERLSNCRYFCEGDFERLKEYLKHDSEFDWRQQHGELVALIYNSFAFLCKELFKKSKHSVPREVLGKLAEHYSIQACRLFPQENSYYYTAGCVFKEKGEWDKAFKKFTRYYKHASSLVDRVAALRSVLQICAKDNREYEDYAKEFVSGYSALKEGRLRFTGEESEIIDGSNLYFLLTECEKLSENNEAVRNLLLKIDDKSRSILNRLKYSSVSEKSIELNIDSLCDNVTRLIPKRVQDSYLGYMENENQSQESSHREIAYYTTLHTAQFLFKGVKKDDNDTDENPPNYLTMMHARHMNDPEEGLVLVRDLQNKKVLPCNAEEMRDILYDQKFVFLKSFTGLIDQLNMWTTYGSDRTEGDDCNGCCICFAPETFDMGSMTQKENQDDSSVRSEDDYDLYNVAYIKDDELYVDKDRDKELENTYEELQNDLKNLKYEIENSDFSDEDKKSIYKCLVRLLEKPMFLFKLFPYHMEEEKRIILSRDLDDRSQVCKTPATDSNPPKLFINPPFQVFPEKIILGPKVKNVDDWIPHLQYELARIKDKWCFYDQRSYNPIVRPSEINIR